MIAAQINAYGDNKVVIINQSTQKPKFTENQVLVKMHAAAVNPVDWKIRAGYLQSFRPVQFPFTLGMDLSGTVEAVGSKVTDFKKGDAVFGMANVFSGGTGAFAEFICVDAEAICLKPSSINDVDAAALPMVGVSAWQALIDYMQLKKGQKILIHGGAGGIGVMAIQIAKYLGAYVATTVSGRSIDFVRNLGADEIIDYHHQQFEKILQNYDAVLDTIGGETYIKSFSVLKKGGMMVSMLESPHAEFMQKYSVNSILEFTDVTHARLAGLISLMERELLKVFIDKIFLLTETADALNYLQYHHPQGKVIITNG